ncbi:MAG: IS5 family transposase [Bacteroidetes bacterium]|nr:IS5 family transposase [Bacteroidota bacterium]
MPIPPIRDDGKGRPRVPDRPVMNGILWVLRTGARWCDMPERFPPYQACHRRFQEWVKAGVFRHILETLAHDLEKRGKFKLAECFIDATFVVAKKGAPEFGKTKRGKGAKLMAVADGAGLPIAIHATSASPHEVTLVEDTLSRRITCATPQRIIGDLAYDSDPLDQRLARRRIELIAPHKINRVKPATQDGRPLRCYRRRWKIERLFSWLQNFRRIATRNEFHLPNYLAFVELGSIIILLRNHF